MYIYIKYIENVDIAIIQTAIVIYDFAYISFPLFMTVDTHLYGVFVSLKHRRLALKCVYTQCPCIIICKLVLQCVYTLISTLLNNVIRYRIV